MDVQAAINALGLSVRAEFVPLSKSRNAKEADLSLNWKVTIERNGREVLTTDYMQGIAHAPAYKAPAKALGHSNSVARFEALQREAETGKRRTFYDRMFTAEKPLDAPSAADVLYCLALDSSVLDYASFEDWAPDLGIDPDSIKGKETYDACLAIGLKLSAAIGADGLAQLREAFQDY